MSRSNKPYLSIVIPAFNEEERIAPTLHRIVEYCNGKNYSYEIIVVDDGSSDDTSGVVGNLDDNKIRDEIKLIRNKHNHGKGYAVKQGVMSAVGEYILFSDADMSTPIEEVEKLIFYLENGYNIAIGSRGLAGSEIKIAQSWYRQNMGRLFNKFIQCTVLRGIKDTQCGFKCFQRDAAFDIFPQQRVWGFCFDVELLCCAQKLGYKIKEVPVVWENSLPSKISLLRDSTKMIWDLIRIYAQYRKQAV